MSNCLDSDQVRRFDSLGMIWVQTVCQGYQQTTLVNRELRREINNYICQIPGTCFHYVFMMVHDITLGLKLEVKSMQRSGTEAIRSQIQPSKPKREITSITNGQNKKRKYGQPSKHLFP